MRRVFVGFAAGVICFLCGIAIGLGQPTLEDAIHDCSERGMPVMYWPPYPRSRPGIYRWGDEDLYAMHALISHERTLGGISHNRSYEIRCSSR